MPRKLYTDKDWLTNRYSTLQQSAKIIAGRCKCNPFTIYRWLKRLGISVRDHSESMYLRSRHVNLSGKALEFLNGELLGDGHLNHDCKRTSSFVRSSKYKKYLTCVKKQLSSFGIRSGRIRRYLDLKLKSRWFDFSSRRYVELRYLQEKWYRPSTKEERKVWPRRKFTKIVPLDLELTPLTCLQWYLGDGTVQDKSLALSTMGFAREEVSLLCQLLERLGFKATVHTNNSIWIWKRSAQDFLDYIGYCPEKISSIYKYKWVLN